MTAGEVGRRERWFVYAVVWWVPVTVGPAYLVVQYLVTGSP